MIHRQTASTRTQKKGQIKATIAAPRNFMAHSNKLLAPVDHSVTVQPKERTMNHLGGPGPIKPKKEKMPMKKGKKK